MSSNVKRQKIFFLSFFSVFIEKGNKKAYKLETFSFLQISTQRVKKWLVSSFCIFLVRIPFLLIFKQTYGRVGHLSIHLSSLTFLRKRLAGLFSLRILYFCLTHFLANKKCLKKFSKGVFFKHETSYELDI